MRRVSARHESEGEVVADEPQRRRERPWRGAQVITKINDNPKPTTTRPVRRLALLLAMGASS